MPEGTEPWSLHDLQTNLIRGRCHEAGGVDALVIEDLLGHLTGVRGEVAGV